MSPSRIERRERTRRPYDHIRITKRLPKMHDAFMEDLNRATMKYGWNRRIFSQVDFELICRHENIALTCVEEGHPGTYWPNIDGRPRINISPHVVGRGIDWVQMHELGHHLCGHGRYDLSKLTKQQSDQLEAEADTFAAVALFPAFLLERHHIREIQRWYPVCAELCEARPRIKAQLGI